MTKEEILNKHLRNQNCDKVYGYEHSSNPGVQTFRPITGLVLEAMQEYYDSKPVTNGEVVYRKVSIADRFPTDKTKIYLAIHRYENEPTKQGILFWAGLNWVYEQDGSASPIYESHPIKTIYWLEEVSQSPVSNNKTIKFLKEENKILRKQLERQSPVMPSEDELYEIGKREISYDRQVAVMGKKEADGVLYFWLKGAKYFRQSEDNDKEKTNTKK